jgi:hypothetical protein
MNMREKYLYEARQRTLIVLVETLLDAGIFRNCLNCEHWQRGINNLPEGCSLARALPPPEVIVVGCEQHTDLIPF